MYVCMYVCICINITSVPYISNFHMPILRLANPSGTIPAGGSTYLEWYVNFNVYIDMYICRMFDIYRMYVCMYVCIYLFTVCIYGVYVLTM